MDWEYIICNDEMRIEFENILKNYFTYVNVYHSDVEDFFSIFGINCPDLEQVHHVIQNLNEQYDIKSDYDYSISLYSGCWIDIFFNLYDEEYDYFIDDIIIDY